MAAGEVTKTVDHVWDLAKKIQIAMLASWDGRMLHSRPMSAHVEREDNAIYFRADRRNHADDDLKKFPIVCLAFGDASDQKYLSITGEASVSNDRELVKRFWNAWAKAWWPSADDPNICVLKVVPTQAEYWDTPGTVVNTIKMAAALVTGQRPDVGENRKVGMR